MILTMDSIDLRIKRSRDVDFVYLLIIILLVSCWVWIFISKEVDVALKISFLIFSTVFGIPLVWMLCMSFVKGKFIKDHKIVLTDNDFSCEGEEFTDTAFKISWEDFYEIQFCKAHEVQITEIKEVHSQHLINFNLFPKQKRYLVESSSGGLFNKALVVALVEKFLDAKNRDDRQKIISKFTAKKIRIPIKNRIKGWCSNCEILCSTDTNLDKSERICTNCYITKLQEVDWNKNYWKHLKPERRAKL